MPAGARIGVVSFPGSLDDRDAARAVRLAGAEPVALWHGDADLRGVDAIVLPGGFSYGDYLRCGAIARFAPVMSEVVEAAIRGMPVLGICNGFQILCEAHLLPGALIRNEQRTFVCRDQQLKVENVATAWTRDFAANEVITIPLKNGEGGYVADDGTLDALEAEGRVVFRYVGPDGSGDPPYPLNPNGSRNAVAGICDPTGRVLGLMPHPERHLEPVHHPSWTREGLAEEGDGLGLFVNAVEAARC